MKSMPITKYFEIVKPTYATLKITPHSGIRNYNSSSLAKMMVTLYKSISRRIKIEERKFFVETKIKCSYIIDITKTDVSFYFIVPIQYVNIAKEKIMSVWNKATVQESEDIPKFTQDEIITYQLNYANNDAFSLMVDRKSNYPLNSILNTVDIMESDDRVVLVYNFLPCSRYGWDVKCEKAHNKFKNNLPINKEANGLSVFVTILFKVVEFLDRLSDELLGKRNNDFNFVSDLSDILHQTNRTISNNTRDKRHDQIIDVQIGVISASSNPVRADNNAISLCQSFQDIQDDNNLEYGKVAKKKAKKTSKRSLKKPTKRALKKTLKKEAKIASKQINVYDYKLKKIKTNKVSSAECQNFLQLPAKELLEKHSINHVNITESVVPEPLQNGYIWAGKHTYKGTKIDTYLSNEKDINNLPLIPMGQMGSGKSILLGGVARNVIENTDEGVVCIDFIKRCELSDYIKAHTPKGRLIEIDLSDPEQRQSLAFNELDISKCHTIDDIVDMASMLTQETVRLIDSINTEGEPLKPKMRRYLTSACNVVFTQLNQSLKDVVRCLEDENYRAACIERLSEGLKLALEEEIYNLKALDDIDNKGFVKGTKDGKIDGVIDRINLLKEDSKLKYMFNKSPVNNINFVDAMNEGKVVLIKMPQAKFSRHHRNILTTFFISKVWLACTLRGDTQDKPLRNHLIVDEIFDAPTSFNVLKDMLVQVRKFQLKLIFSVHYLTQIEPIRESLKASGASYMLLQGTDKKNFRELESELYPYTVEDLLNLKQYHSLNMMKYSKGYATYISDLTRKI